ncbi:M1 family metallopeptidase [Sorangium cellulosum]|uniref:Aminopeptidase N n=1 Tax=Sorangium cellulosum So0157-2 TaxID=1254432 RepID=S4YBN9_SORCE|nr:M1 family aminopeptidase [Sorangium cellulosum]AGP41770.1 aminopeptidase [Sorangium cellulosum So0157-2]
MDLVRSFVSPGARLAAVLLASLAAACSGADPVAPGQAPPDDRQQPPPDTGPPPEPEPPAGAAIDVQRYEVTGEFDWSRGRLVATVAMTLLPGDDGLRSLRLDSAVAEVKAVRLAGGADLPYAVDAEPGALRIDVSRVPGIAADQAITLEIDYEAAESEALRAIPARWGDPAASRVVYTISEPLNAALWLPCHNTPEDRAVFSIDLAMDAHETMIANGTLVSDEQGASGRRMRYATDYTVPTYLMAFAIGDFEVEGTMKGSLPVSVWHRRGVPGDYGRLLDEAVRSIGLFEELLVPYPFEKYAVVLVPEFGGGIENLGISFQGELGSTAPTMSEDLKLTIHEIAHQWFGDLVTVKSWDDLWIKEGMATLLASEGARVYLDESGEGTLNGDSFSAGSHNPIVDPDLAPADKYTSGPYGRAAWLLTQIRSLVGEEAFWGTLRDVLNDHRFGAIGTDEFLDAFAGPLGPDAAARARRAVRASALPHLDLGRSPSGGVLVTLRDPDGALVAPIDLLWIADDGATRSQVLELDKGVDVAPQREGELLILDPLDRHVSWHHLIDFSLNPQDHPARLSSFRVPASPSQVASLLEAGGAHQTDVLWAGLPEPVTPGAFAAFLDGLDAEDAKGLAVAAACERAADPALDPALRAAWSSALAPLLAGPPYARWTEFSPWAEYGACGEVVDVLALYADEWSALAAGPPAGDLSDAHLRFLFNFDLPLETVLSAWGNVARQSSSLRARSLATARIRTEADRAPPEDFPAFRAFFSEIVASTEVSELLMEALTGLSRTMAPTAAENAEALAALGQQLRTASTTPFDGWAVCLASALTQGDAAAWSEFVRGLDGVELSAEAAEMLEDLARC